MFYRLPVNETVSGCRNKDQIEPAHVLSREFSRTVTTVCKLFYL